MSPVRARTTFTEKTHMIRSIFIALLKRRCAAAIRVGTLATLVQFVSFFFLFSLGGPWGSPGSPRAPPRDTFWVTLGGFGRPLWSDWAPLLSPLEAFALALGALLFF